MKNNLFSFRAKLFLLAVFALSACQKDPFEGFQSNERAITSFKIDKGQVGVAEISRTPEEGKIVVYVVPGTDLSSISPQLTTSYKANVNPGSGEPINLSDSTYAFTVTAESGETREWTLEVEAFDETLAGTYQISNLVVFGGTGPEYGGAGVLAMTDKPWAWPEVGGPAAEFDNVLTFDFTGVTEEGKTYGTVTNYAGPDEMYADFLFVMDPQTDVNHFYRKIPKGESQWERDYDTNTVTFTAPDGTVSVASLAGPGTIELEGGSTKEIAERAFEFALEGTDDWDKIYTDYDKFVKQPRRFWVEVKKQ